MKKNSKKAWDLTPTEFQELSDRIPFKNKVGVYQSLTGKYTIELKNNERVGTAGLAYLYEVFINGERMEVPYTYVRKLLFELPDDYRNWITYKFVQDYKKSKEL